MIHSHIYAVIKSCSPIGPFALRPQTNHARARLEADQDLPLLSRRSLSPGVWLTLLTVSHTKTSNGATVVWKCKALNIVASLKQAAAIVLLELCCHCLRGNMDALAAHSTMDFFFSSPRITSSDFKTYYTESPELEITLDPESHDQRQQEK